MNDLLEPRRRVVVGHRGAAGEAPENTLPAFLRAVEVGADALELDVRVTADGVPVVIHDPILDRTTDLSGVVSALTLKEMGRADAGSRFTRDGGQSHPWRGRGVTVPTLAEVLRATAGVPLIIDVKDARSVHAIAVVLDRHGARDRCVIGSFEADALRAFRARDYRSAATRGEVARTLIGSLLGLAPRSPPWCVLTIPARYHGVPVAVRPLLRAAARAGCPTHVWTVDDPARARRLWVRGAAGIITNVPAVMVAARAAD